MCAVVCGGGLRPAVAFTYRRTGRNGDTDISFEKKKIALVLTLLAVLRKPRLEVPFFYSAVSAGG